jgi:plastocyanin domain-containing protein
MKKQIMRSLIAGSMILAMLFGGNAVFANGSNGNTKNGAKKKAAAHPKTVRVTVGKNGFSPSSINVEEGFPLTLIFKRTSKQSCGDKVVFPSLNITKNLPVGKAVTVKFTPDKTGEIAFTCGMNMFKGSIIVQ